MLDNRWYKDWLELVAAEFIYRMPVPITPDNPAAPHYDASGGVIVDERVRRLPTTGFAGWSPTCGEIAWGEVPPVRFRHFVTTCVSAPSTSPLMTFAPTCWSAPCGNPDQSDLMAVERFDAIAEGARNWTRLTQPVRRTEATVLGVPQLRAIL